jgi:hypothetical protein
LELSSQRLRNSLAYQPPWNITTTAIRPLKHHYNSLLVIPAGHDEGMWGVPALAQPWQCAVL